MKEASGVSPLISSMIHYKIEYLELMLNALLNPKTRTIFGGDTFDVNALFMDNSILFYVLAERRNPEEILVDIDKTRHIRIARLLPGNKE